MTAPKATAATSFDDTVDSLLTMLHLCDDTHNDRFTVPLAAMDGAVFTQMGAGYSLHQDLIELDHGRPAEWPVNIAIACPDPDDGAVMFRRLASCSRANLRQRGARRFSSHGALWDHSRALPDGTATSFSLPIVHLGRWQSALPDYDPSFYPEIPMVGCLVAMDKLVRSKWTVWLGYAQGPRVQFITDPTGAREVFRLRDLPAGRQRRAALRHWVTAHARQGRARDEDLIWVRQHLRGAQEFTWNGLRCRVQPSAADMETANG